MIVYFSALSEAPKRLTKKSNDKAAAFDSDHFFRNWLSYNTVFRPYSFAPLLFNKYANIMLL